MSKDTKKKRTAKQNESGKRVKSTKKQRRRMNWKERLGLFLVILAALALCFVMVINMKILPVVNDDGSGHIYTTHISLMDRFKSWKPFEEMNGKLEEKD